VVTDLITRVEPEAQQLFGGIESPYSYDYLVLALGSETGYFNIPGLPEFAYGLKSIPEALTLRAHVHAALTPPADPATPTEVKVAGAHFMIIGGGPTGTELAGDLGKYARRLAKQQNFDPSLITIDLIEAAPRVLPMMPADVSARVAQHLQSLGVNLFLNRTVTGEEAEQLTMKDATVKTKSVIWTSGVKVNGLVASIPGLELDKRGKVVVDSRLRAKGHKNVFIAGDIASIEFSGLAQTALDHGRFIARMIASQVRGQGTVQEFVPHKPIYAIPAGPGWAAVLWGSVRIYGWVGFMLREAADLRFFLTILPIAKALKVFSKHDVLSEDCPVCEPEAAAAPAK